MPEDQIPQAIELEPANYVDLAVQRLLDNPLHYVTSPTGLFLLVVAVAGSLWRNHVRRSQK